MRVVHNGLCFMGPPCNSWVIASQSYYKRSSRRPRGDIRNPDVLKFNAIADFVANLVDLCVFLGVYFVIEQPLSSLLFAYPSIARALAEAGAHRVVVWLGKFGADTPKPLALWGTAPWLTELAYIDSTLPQLAQGTLCDTDSSGGFTGRRDGMAESALYPARFCRLVARLQSEHTKPAGL